MADMKNNGVDEQPLDALSETVRRKMMRLMAVSVGTMFIGFFAVLFAIVYKLNYSSAEPTLIDAEIALPRGFQIEETKISDGLLLMRGNTAVEGQSILMFDAVTGNPRGKIDIK